MEVASREFVDNMTSLLRAPLGINNEVRQRMIELIQLWALLFTSRSTELGYMMSTYQSLRNEGVQFPPEERVAAAFVDSAAPPDWADSDVCMRCRTAFTFRNRKHHCRNCGNVFCGQCSSQSMPLPHLGIATPVRVCDGCFSKKAQSQPSNTQSLPPSTIRPTVPSYQQVGTSKHSAEHEDMEFKRALEMSLAESKQSSMPKTVQAVPAQAINAGDEEDEDLKAAIAASLQETKQQEPVKEAYTYPSLSATAQATYDSSSLQAVVQPYSTAQPDNAPLPRLSPHELLPAEQENIHLFATLIERLKTDQRGAILRDPQIQELFESISALRPKLARSLGDTVGKYESLVETHSKLATVVKYYDRILEARLASTYSRDPYANYDHRQDSYASQQPISGGYYSTQDVPTDPYSEQQVYNEPNEHHQSYPEHVTHARQPYGMQQHVSVSHVGQQQGRGYDNGAEVVQDTAAPQEEVSLIDL